VESKLGPLCTSAYCTCPEWLWGWRIWWNEDWQGKPKCSEKTCPSSALSTTNPTWPDPGSSPGRRVESQRLTAWAMARPLRPCYEIAIGLLYSWVSCKGLQSPSNCIVSPTGEVFKFFYFPKVIPCTTIFAIMYLPLISILFYSISNIFILYISKV
jgi:hypothetical protein